MKVTYWRTSVKNKRNPGKSMLFKQSTNNVACIILKLGRLCKVNTFFEFLNSYRSPNRKKKEVEDKICPKLDSMNIYRKPILFRLVERSEILTWAILHRAIIRLISSIVSSFIVANNNPIMVAMCRKIVNIFKSG